MDRDDVRELAEIAALTTVYVAVVLAEIVLATIAIWATGHYILGVW